MAGNEWRENSPTDKPDSDPIIKGQRARFRTVVDYNKAYMYPHVDALDDTYCTLSGDIKRMKATNPVPQEVLAEAEEELVELKKEMEKAGFEFYS